MQEFFKNETTAALRRVYFVCVDITSLTTRISSSQMSIGSTRVVHGQDHQKRCSCGHPSGSTITDPPPIPASNRYSP